MENLDIFYEKLRSAVEKRINKKMATPRDFEYLAMRLLDCQKTYISSMSLKRFWGYLGKDNVTVPRQSTLNLLSQFAGYTDWKAFCASSSGNAEVQSEFILSDTIYATSIEIGAVVRLVWNPDRMVMAVYQGHDQFKVLQSENSKLSVGDTFCCGQFVSGEPLYLNRLIHEGGAPMNYVCGKEDGVQISLVFDEQSV